MPSSQVQEHSGEVGEVLSHDAKRLLVLQRERGVGDVRARRSQVDPPAPLARRLAQGLGDRHDVVAQLALQLVDPGELDAPIRSRRRRWPRRRAWGSSRAPPPLRPGRPPRAAPDGADARARTARASWDDRSETRAGRTAAKYRRARGGDPEHRIYDCLRDHRRPERRARAPALPPPP